MKQRAKGLYSDLFVVLLLYLNVIIGFALAYAFLDQWNLGALVDHHAAEDELNSFQKWSRALYFSSITLLSVGYGDITPFGWSRFVAVIEAMIGYILPASLIVHFVLVRRRAPYFSD